MFHQIESIAKAGAKINPEDFYPPARKHKGKSRDLPMVDAELRNALIQYLHLRIEKAEKLKPSFPLFISQKGVPYSLNTLQEHEASSYSGRRSLITNVIQKKSVKVAQIISGHVNPSTTLIYEESMKA